jgi:hypothetical protein
MSRTATANMFDILSEDGPKQPAPAKAAEAPKAAAPKTDAPAAAAKKETVGAQKPARESQNRGDKSDAPARTYNRIPTLHRTSFFFLLIFFPNYFWWTWSI